MKKNIVLITGISGWIAQFCAVELIKKGFHVRGSLRNMQRQNEVTTAISTAVEIADNLSFCKLDILHDDGWDAAMENCTYVMHVASPFIIEEPNHPDDLIRPAEEGTIRALTAAQKAKVNRVVVTSSIIAMMAHLTKGQFDPTHWTDLSSNNITSYARSKTIAEKKAWDFFNNQTSNEHQIELVTINPGGVMGPTLSDDIEGASLNFCAQLLTKKMPGIPNVGLPMVDVRDVAKHHVAAMLHPDANGKRYISAQSESTPFLNIAQLLKKHGYDVPTKKVPSFVIKLLALFDKEAKGMVPLLNKSISCDNSSTVSAFNWTPESLETTIIDMAKSVQKVLNKKH